MKFHTSTVLFAISLSLFIIEKITGIDVVVLMYDFHSTFFDKMLPVVVITTAGLIIDYIKYLLQRKEHEKTLIYKQTMVGMNHLVRNLQNSFMIINTSDAIKKEFGNDIIDLLNQSSREVELILEKLSQLEEITPSTIKKISFSNVK